MARFAAGLLAGMVITAVAGAALGIHAEDVSAEVLEAAAVAHVDPVKLQDALSTLQAAGMENVDAYTYLRSEGDLPPLAPPQLLPGHVSPRVDCIVHYESRGDAHAVNPRSGAAGLGQFLASTWRSTPQGRAGLSVFDPTANRAAVGWMVSVGRAREFDVVRMGMC